MTNLADIFEPRGVGASVAAQGIIADIDGPDVYAIVPSFDATNRWGPLLGVESVSGLARGDEVLVIFDEESQPWLMQGGGGGGGGTDVDATAHTTTLAPGSPATVDVTEPVANLFDFAFGIPAGVQGAKGDTGAAGAQGPKGDTGAQGAQGVQGPIGPQGPKGDQGVKGDTGAQGPQGVQGPKGDTGATGPMGTVYDSDQIGTIKAFSGKVIPTNWMLADGRTLNRASYPQLADVLGVAAGATTFTIPDLRAKFMLGGNSTLSDILTNGGESAHVLTVAEMASHSHGGSTVAGSTPDHLHSVLNGGNFISTTGNINASIVASGTSWNQSNTTGAADRSLSHAHNINAEGGGAAHNNMPPYVVLAYMIKATGVQIDSGGALVGPVGPQGIPGNSITVAIEPWHTVGAGGEPAFQNGWAVFSGYGPVGFQKDPLGRVHLRGSIYNGANGVVAFTLPVGYRPVVTPRTIAIGNQTATGQWEAQVNIGTDGTVVPYYTGPAANAYVGLDLVEFDTGTVTQYATGPQGPKGDTGAGWTPVEAVRYVGGAGQPAFQNGWVNYDNGAAGPSGNPTFRDLIFWKDPYDVVHIQGTIKTGAVGSPIFTLPAGYRPTRQSVYCVVVASGGVAWGSIFSDGGVAVAAVGGSTPAAFVMLDGMTFRLGV